MNKFVINSKLGIRCVFSTYEVDFLGQNINIVFFNHDKTLDIVNKRDIDRLIDNFQDEINNGANSFDVGFISDYFPEVPDDVIILFVNLDEYIINNKEKKKKKKKIIIYEEVDVDEDWTVYKVAKESPPMEWTGFFLGCKENLIDISKSIKRIEREKGKCLPLRCDIFNAFKYTSPKRIKVVIFGQDPYTTIRNKLPIANGLSFSVRKGVPIPPTLKNMYIELKNDIDGFEIPNHGDLSRWVIEEGVMLLNASLTVSPKKTYSSEEEKDTCVKGTHKNVWIGFITKCIGKIYSSNKNVIFILWGKDAIDLKKFIPAKARILEGVHPSPLSARRGFFGCKHFSKTNELLKQQGLKPIDWSLE